MIAMLLGIASALDHVAGAVITEAELLDRGPHSITNLERGNTAGGVVCHAGGQAIASGDRRQAAKRAPRNFSDQRLAGNSMRQPAAQHARQADADATLSPCHPAAVAVDADRAAIGRIIAVAKALSIR